MGNIRRLLDVYQFPGFRPKATIKGIFGDPKARVLRLERGKKTVCGCCGTGHQSYYDSKTRRIRDLSCGDVRAYLEVAVRRVSCRRCGKVKREWLANNPLYTKRFAWFVGRRCRAMSIRDVAKDVHLDWHTVKGLEKQYMAEQPLWFGGQDRSEASLDAFYEWVGPKQRAGIRLAVLDMWKAFESSTRKNAPQAAILYDKFHVMRHLGEALDQVRKMEYGRLFGKDRSYIKGQKYTLLSNRENLTLDGRKALQKLLGANTRLQTAYLLKETFGQLWSYQTEGWARRFFDHWQESLRWQRLRPYAKFAEMIERHGDGIAAYSRPENKVSLGFVEGLNNKIRVIQRRAYGLQDEEYLRLKILTCMLKEI